MEDSPAQTPSKPANAQQPLAAGSRPVNWPQASQAWRQSSPDRQTPWLYTATSAQQRADMTAPSSDAKAADSTDSAAHTSPLSGTRGAPERATDQNSHHNLANAAAAGMAGSFLPFNKSAAYPSRSFVHRKGQQQTSGYMQTSDQAASTGQSRISGQSPEPLSQAEHSVPARNAGLPVRDELSTTMQGLQVPHRQKRPASAASLDSARSHDGAGPATVPSANLFGFPVSSAAAAGFFPANGPETHPQQQQSIPADSSHDMSHAFRDAPGQQRMKPSAFSNGRVIFGRHHKTQHHRQPSVTQAQMAHTSNAGMLPSAYMAQPAGDFEFKAGSPQAGTYLTASRMQQLQPGFTLDNDSGASANTGKRAAEAATAEAPAMEEALHVEGSQAADRGQAAAGGTAKQKHESQQDSSTFVFAAAGDPTPCISNS